MKTCLTKQNEADLPDPMGLPIGKYKYLEDCTAKFPLNSPALQYTVGLNARFYSSFPFLNLFDSREYGVDVLTLALYRVRYGE